MAKSLGRVGGSCWQKEAPVEVVKVAAEEWTGAVNQTPPETDDEATVARFDGNQKPMFSEEDTGKAYY